MLRKKQSAIGTSGNNSRDDEDFQVTENPYYGCANTEILDSRRMRNDFDESGNMEIVNVSTNIYYGL